MRQRMAVLALAAVVLATVTAGGLAGVDRFYNLVRSGCFEEVRCFRVVPGFLVQFGIHGNPAVANAWVNATLNDEPVTRSVRRGTLA